MKKVSFTIFCFLLAFTYSTMAQTDSATVARLVKEIENLKDEVETLKNQQISSTDFSTKANELNSAAQKKYHEINLVFEAHTDSLANYYHYIFGIVPEIKRNGEKIQDISDKKDKADNDKWNDTQVNLRNMPRSFMAMNSRLNVIQSNLSNQQKNELLLQITNPQSGALGFKLGDKIMELLESEILKKTMPSSGRKKDLDVYKAKSASIINVVNQITKSPVLNSIPGISSALSMTNVVTGFLRSVSFMENQISQSDITGFESELNRYILFYNSLHDNQQQNAYNTARLENKLLILQESFFQYIEINASALDFSFSGKPENYSSKAAYFTAFTDDFEQYIQTYFNNYKPKTEDGVLSQKTEMLIELNKDLDKMLHFYNELKKLYEEYTQNEEDNRVATKKTLQMAADSGIASEKKVKTMVKRLNKTTANSKQNFETAVNLRGLEKEVKKLSYKYKMF